MSGGGGGSVKSRNFRRRSEEDANGEDNAPSLPTAGPAAPTAAGGKSRSTIRTQTRPPAASKPRNLLSFADEEESPVRRSTSSRPPSVAAASSTGASLHRITTAKDRASAPLVKVSALQPQIGEYTREKLLELQKNARSLGSLPKTSTLPSSSTVPIEATRPAKAETPAEPVIVLKGLEGLVKPVAVQKEKTPAAPTPQREQDEDMAQLEGDLKMTGDVAGRRFAGLDISGKGKDSSLIPDQATINAIRAKRERLRQARVSAPDYISLDSGAGPRAAGGSSDEEDNDFRGRISLHVDETDQVSGKGVFESTVEKTTAALGEDVREAVEEDEEDEEERLWEEEQFRKGLGKRFEEAPSSKPVNPQPAVYAEASLQYVSRSLSLEGSYGFSKSAETMSISQQADVATRALREGIGKLKEAHSRTCSSLARTDENLSEALTNITSLEKSLSAADEKFVFMQKLRDFISVMCSFLQDKAPYIEELEEQMQKLHEDRASAIRERRDADNADEMADVEAGVSAAMSVLSGGSSAALVSAAASAARDASAAARASSNLPVQLDEFGRDVNRQKRLDMERRAEARKRRKARAETKRLSTMATDQPVEGELSTDESDSEAEAYSSSREELLLTAGLVFSDAAEEFSKLSSVKERLEQWKKLYASSYRDAYMSLSTPHIFAPYMRLELLKWDPLRKQTDFCDMQWHDELFSYGLQEDNGNFDPDDPDANLIPELVEQVALPLLRHEVKHCWDVLSTRMTRNAVLATNLVISYLQPSSRKLAELVAEIRARLSEAVESLSVPNWNVSVARAVPDAAHITAYRFGRAVRLLKNVCLWKDVLAPAILEELALDVLLARKVVPHLRSVMPNLQDAITRTERVVSALAGVWTGAGVAGDHSRKLQLLTECVGEMGRRLEKRQAAGVEEDGTLGLARRVKKMLVELNEYDKARAILKTFKLKEAL